MDHVETIKRLLKTMQASQKMHALIVTGPAGFGKSTAVDEALQLSGAPVAHLGAYSSPLNFFNFLYENANSGATVVIDDVAGLYSEPSSMALLKAATWAQGKPRTLTWGSTSGKAEVDQFEFNGKICIVANSFPSTSDANAVRSRAFQYEFKVSVVEAKELLLQAAQTSRWFVECREALDVAHFLADALNESTLSKISYRTLEIGCELASHNPDDWEELLGRMIAAEIPVDPYKVIERLSGADIKVGEQVRRFEKATGFKRRTFFKYRRELRSGTR